MEDRNVFKILLVLIVLSFQGHNVMAQNQFSKSNKKLIREITSTDGFVALWKFNEKPGKERKAVGKGRFPLAEGNGNVERLKEGPVSGYSIRLDGSNYLSLSNTETEELNIAGTGKEVTVVAWVKWTGEQTGFVGGMWNEYKDGGKRQYGLFVSLPYYNGADQVCGHISESGKATPPFPYSIDYSASPQKVPANVWCCVAFTYDGEYIRSYLNGEFKARKPELINHTKGFDGYPDGLIQTKNPYHFPYGMGDNGSDFTVGAVLLHSGMGNFFKGQIGGLAVFNKALSEEKLAELVR